VVDVHEAGETVTVYNMEVEQFHTYFVGQRRLLVHNNSILGAPSSRLVPGGGLAAHEAQDGHLLLKHVGKTEAELSARLVAEPHISAASTFVTRAEAEAGCPQCSMRAPLSSLRGSPLAHKANSFCARRSAAAWSFLAAPQPPWLGRMLQSSSAAPVAVVGAFSQGIQHNEFRRH